MKFFDTVLTSPAVQVFGWALLHSLWQGLILTILLKVALNVSKISANARYLIACATLSLMLILPISTALWSSPEIPFIDSGNPAIQSVTIAENEISSATVAPTVVHQSVPTYKTWLHQTEKNLMPWLVLVWSIGVFVSSLRLLGVWTYTQRLKKIEKQNVLEQWRETLQKLCKQLSVSKPVTLLESSLVKVPTVIGWIKPIILIPPSALSGLTPQQLELILAHELAHIRRHDYLVNLFQTVVETFLFYHPAAWWVSNQIRNERENACDDLAVSVSGDAVVYARTLVELERLRKAAPSLAMAADGGSLKDRIHRLVGVEIAHQRRFSGLWVVIFVTLLMVTVAFTKQNSSVIKERVEDILSLNLSSKADSELSEQSVEITETKTVKEQKTTKTEDGKNTVVSEEETKAETSVKEVAVSEPEPEQEVAEVPPPMPALPVSSEMPIETPEMPVPAPTNINTNVNVKYVRDDSDSQDGDFIEEMASVGYTNLTIEQLINLKSIGVTAAYVKGLRAAGLNNLTVRELSNLCALGVNGAYIEAIRNAGYKDLTAKEFSNFKAVGVTPERISQYKSAGYDNLSARDVSNFSVHGITPAYISQMNSIGFGKLSARDLVQVRIFGITPEFIKTARGRLGNDLTLKQIIELKNLGILKGQDKDQE